MAKKTSRPGWELIKRILLDLDLSLKNVKPAQAKKEFKELRREIGNAKGKPKWKH